ncbi:hypothetical protein K2P97_05185 [bacterium]|nr:hypothetical protein [bacterium]
MSRALAAHYELPLIHVDSIQFLPEMKLRDPSETRKVLVEYSLGHEWIIDGLGPLKIIEDRFQKSDLVLVIRIPFWRNVLWVIKRQVKSLFSPREELPKNSKEASFEQTVKLFRNMWNVQNGLWVQLDRIFLRDIYKNKVRYIRSVVELNKILVNGLD